MSRDIAWKEKMLPLRPGSGGACGGLGPGLAVEGTVWRKNENQTVRADGRPSVREDRGGAPVRPGSKLPNENDLSRRLDVSRTTLRAGDFLPGGPGDSGDRRGKGTYVSEELPAVGLDMTALAGVRGPEFGPRTSLRCG
jgi:hypothetical protein